MTSANKPRKRCEGSQEMQTTWTTGLEQKDSNLNGMFRLSFKKKKAIN
jgi:hypothetical protein